MKTSIAFVLGAYLLPGIASTQAATAPDQEKPAAAVAAIDDTPVMPLEVGGNIKLLQNSGNLQDPMATAWRGAQEYRMSLSAAPPVHQSINLRYDATAPAQPVFVRAASDGKKLYLRLRWPDASHNIATTRSEFADGAAVQFALDAGGPDGTTTSFMMGSADSPVNIWYWKAGQSQPQNLAAVGFGSTTQLAPAGLESSSEYRKGGEWIVVFSRPLRQVGDHLVNLESGTTNAAFALWQGDQQQRDGLKQVTMGWVTLEPAL